jgi:hypothetical protein
VCVKKREGYSRLQVERAERRALSVVADEEYYCDGIYFWLRDEEWPWSVAPEEAPDSGWRY